MLKVGLLALTAPALPHRPLLSQGQASAIAQYFAKSLYNHYELHVYLYVNPQQESKTDKAKPLETPMPPLGITTGMTQADYDEKLRLEAEAKKKAEDSAARDQEAAELTRMLENT